MCVLSHSQVQDLCPPEVGGERGGVGRTMQSWSTASQAVAPFLCDLPNCQWLCSVSQCGPRGLLESARSSVMIQGDQGEDTQRIPAPLRKGLHTVHLPAPISGAQTLSEPSFPHKSPGLLVFFFFSVFCQTPKAIQEIEP